MVGVSQTIRKKKILMVTTHRLRTTDLGQINKFLTFKSLFTHTHVLLGRARVLWHRFRG